MDLGLYEACGVEVLKTRRGLTADMRKVGRMLHVARQETAMTSFEYAQEVKTALAAPGTASLLPRRVWH